MTDGEDFDAYLQSRAEELISRSLGPVVAKYEPGENLDTLIVDHRADVRRARTPVLWAPVEDALCRTLRLSPDRMRLLSATETAGGPVTLWELLHAEGQATAEWVVASPGAARPGTAPAGAPRLHLGFAWSEQRARQMFAEKVDQLDGTQDG